MTSHFTYIRLLLITSLLLMAVSCGTSRKAPSIAGEYSSGEVSSARTPQWADLRIPISVNLTEPSSFKINGIMTMVNDRSIHISLRMLGFEVGAAYITGDSLFAYAKLQKVYVAESIRDALGGINATVGDVQSLLIGAPLQLPLISGNTAITIERSEQTGQPLAITVAHPSGRTGTAVYTPAEGLPYASSVAVTATNGTKNIHATLSYDWNRTEADSGAERQFSIPHGYRRINGASLLKSLTNR